MELQFQQTKDGYSAEFLAEKPFSLHIESSAPISVMVYIKSVEDGQYDLFKVISSTGLVYDRELPIRNFPKWVKIESKYELSKVHAVFSNSVGLGLSFNIDENGDLIVNS